MHSFEESVAIVTGGTGALGSVIAQAFHGRGARVAIPYTSEKSRTSLQSLFPEGNAKFLFVQADLTSEKEVEGLVGKTLAQFGRIDILVNAAGGYRGGSPVHETPSDDWNSLLALNLTTTFLTAKAVLPLMLKQSSGRIINIAAMTALKPERKKVAYAVSKRGVVTLTEVLAEETKGTGVTVNAIAPSIILTEANKEWMSGSELSKAVTPGEIASLIMFLSSPEARSISGNTVKISGGV